ncbi:radical SAM protein [Candidatus Sumerlaeota bacterium]|nr:radical SAM protein [Candidatus Sumerlaeota bacterium]
MKQCDVLFVNPPSPDGYIYIRDFNRCGKRTRERRIWPQTSLAILAAIARRAGYKVDVLDCIASRISWDDYHEYVKAHEPRWTVSLAITSILTDDLFATVLGKQCNSHTVVLGPHITALPVETMRAYPTIDFGILGEPEETFEELLKTVDGGGDLGNVRGIVYRRNGEIVVNEPRPFIKDLDSLPLPLHELLPMDKYRMPYIGKRYTFVLHSRGCPYACTFCRQTVMWRSQPRLRSPASIIAELKYLARLDVHKVLFHADNFTQNRENVVELCRRILDDNLKVRWICNSRVDCVDAEMLRWMSKAGCWMINYGIESGAQEILDNCNKGGRATVERARQTIAMTKKAGIKAWGYFVIGLPGETRETIEQTSRFARSLPLDLVVFDAATPYPGTEFHEQAVKNGWLESTQWEDLDQGSRASVSYPHLSSSEIMAGIGRCYRQWFMRPRGALAVLKGLRSPCDIVEICRLVASHLNIGKSEPRA